MNRQGEQLDAAHFKGVRTFGWTGQRGQGHRFGVLLDLLVGAPYHNGKATLAERTLNAIRAVFKAPVRFPLLYSLDIATTAICLACAAVMRLGLYDTDRNGDVYAAVLMSWPIEVLICAILFPATGLYSRSWRFASLSDLLHILRSVLLSSLMFVAAIFLFTRLQSIPRSVVAINMVLLMVGLTATRLTFRYDELFASTTSTRRRTATGREMLPVLLIGAGDSAAHYLRALQRDPDAHYWPVGFVDKNPNQTGLLVRGVPVLGAIDDIEQVLRTLDDRGERPRHVIFTESPVTFDQHQADLVVEVAERLGIQVSRLAPATELRAPKAGEGFELRPIELTDLLARPQITQDRARLGALLRGSRVLVTGAGGSIGSELVRQIAAVDPAEIVLIDNCEYNLYAIDLELGEKFRDIPRVAYLCNVRDAARVNEIFERHRPDLIYHAAALKHVPMVELNPCEGVHTNVIGTMNVAEAAKRIGARAMVQVSTDKVVNPTSVMGATKRLAELYCQALELDAVQRNESGSRFMTVRFGNVLGSSGSLIPLFKRQLANGGPLTVTDPEMKRFFMTIREAVELTLLASAYGVQASVGRGEIFVLDMGEPVKIIDIARRLIRLAGYVPDKDIKIEIVGCRPGEKLYEELFDDSEQRVASPVPGGVLGAVPSPVPLPVLKDAFEQLSVSCQSGDTDALFRAMKRVLPKYQRQGEQPAQRTAPAREPVRQPELTL
jgi:O-antigen biosynthesis protein WbqV